MDLDTDVDMDIDSDQFDPDADADPDADLGLGEEADAQNASHRQSPYTHDPAPLVSMFKAEFCRLHQLPREDPLKVAVDLGSRGGALNALEKARKVMGARLGDVRTWYDLPVGVFSHLAPCLTPLLPRRLSSSGWITWSLGRRSGSGTGQGYVTSDKKRTDPRSRSPFPTRGDTTQSSSAP